MKIVVDKDEYEELKKYKRENSRLKKRIEELKETKSLLEERIEWIEELVYKEQRRHREFKLKELCAAYGCTENELIEEMERRFSSTSPYTYIRTMSKNIRIRTKALDREMQTLRYCAKQLEKRV